MCIFVKENRNRLGMSIIEVMVAISILMIGLMAVISLMTQNIKAAGYNRHKVVASMLAQEGIEFVRSERDNNYITEGIDGWYIGIIDNPDNEFVVDLNGFDFWIDIIDNAQLFLDGNGYYSHAGPTVTPFSRLIIIEKFPNTADPDYIRVVSQVRWQEKGKIFDYFAESYFYGWR